MFFVSSSFGNRIDHASCEDILVYCPCLKCNETHTILIDTNSFSMNIRWIPTEHEHIIEAQPHHLIWAPD